MYFFVSCLLRDSENEELMLRLVIPSINKVIAWNRKIWLQSCGHVTALIERCLRCLFTGSKQTGVKKGRDDSW